MLRLRPTTAQSHSEDHLFSRRVMQLVPCVAIFIGCVLVYARTAAPSVMGGDSAEFQMAAPLLGVAHPTTYPLYTLLGKLFTLLVPFGDLAHRVTLVSAFTAALAVALMLAVAWHTTRSVLAGALAALALAVTPGLWNSATMAEVYGLLAALLAATWLIVLHARERGWPLLLLAAFFCGLGVSHHGLFVFTGVPLVFGAFAWRLLESLRRGELRQPFRLIRPYLLAALCAIFGLAPWLYPLIQFARFGPFSGEDYGLPRHYFWGAPANWPDAIGMLTGGPIRNGAFRLPNLDGALAIFQMIAERLWFEFGLLGCGLGLIGVIALFRADWRMWLASAWLFIGTTLYLLLLGPAVQDAPIFTLPMLLPCALWIGFGATALARLAALSLRSLADGRYSTLMFSAVLAGLVCATLVWGTTRMPYANKRRLTVWRDFGQTTLSQLPPNAVVIAHWEQGMVLQYLVLAERQRPDVWIDVVEPSDDAWGPRAQRRYAQRVVFLIGSATDVANLPVTLVRDDPYAQVYRLDPASK